LLSIVVSVERVDDESEASLFGVRGPNSPIAAIVTTTRSDTRNGRWIFNPAIGSRYEA
jgi:hypothetical protein